MAALRVILRRAGQWLGGATFAGAIVGLPIAVAVRAPVDDRSTGMAKPRNAIIITTPARISPLVKLTIDAGVLHSGDGSPIATERPVRRIEAEGAVFTLDLSPAVASIEEAPLAVTDLGRMLAQLADLKVEVVALKRARLDVVRSDGSRLRLTHIAGELRSIGRDSFTAAGTARLSGHPISFDATWSRPVDPKREGGFPLNLSMTGNLVDARFTGRLSFHAGPKLEGRTEIRSRKVRALSRLLGLPVDIGQDLRAGSLAGDMTWSNGLIAFPKATIGLDGNEATGVLSLKTGGPRPKIEGTLAFGSFSVARYLEALADGLGAQKQGGPDAMKPLLAVVDADLRISADKVVAPRLELGRAALTVSIKNGRMLADVAEVEIEGGTAGGQITLDVNGPEPRIGLKLRADKVDPGRVFSEALQRNPLMGRTDITIDASGTGRTLGEIVQSLVGRGTLKLVESGRLGLDLRALTNVVHKAEASGWSAAGRGNTPLTALEARYQIVGGGLTFESITGQSGSTAYIGGGRVDVLRRLLDLSLAHGSATASEVPVTVRDAVRIHGPWNAPRFDVLPSPFSNGGPTLRGWLGTTPETVKAAPPSTPERARASMSP